MKRLFAFVALSLALSACGGGGSRTLPAINPGSPSVTPPKPAALAKIPQSRDFVQPALPSALQRLHIGDLPAATRDAFLTQRSVRGAARAPQGRSTGFFANETYVGKDANGFAAYWMPYFGFYTYGSTTQGAIPFPGFLYKYNFAWLYDLGGTNASSSDAYFFDFGAPDGYVGVFYTASNYGSDDSSLYLYSFLLNHFLSYQQNSSSPRWFYDYAAAAWLTGNPPQTGTAGGLAAFARADTHRTLYYLDVDTASSQMCTAGCLGVWPALAAIPGSTAAGGLTVITRSDGGQQWAYEGHPLYTYAGDNGANQANGDNVPDFGGHWHVARPAGTADPTPAPDPTEPPCIGYC